jgi:hypothetical protein
VNFIERTRALFAQKPLQYLSHRDFCRPEQCSQHRRSARGLFGQGAARLQGQFPPATMAEVMAPISDEQILDLAYYIARVGAK